MLQPGIWPEQSKKASALRGFRPAFCRWPSLQISDVDFVNLKVPTSKTSVYTAAFTFLGWYSYRDLGSTGDSMIEAVPKWMHKGAHPTEECEAARTKMQRALRKEEEEAAAPQPHK